MRFANIEDLALDGSEFLAKDVFSSNNRLLAKQGLQLNAGIIKKIRNYQVFSLYVTDYVAKKVEADEAYLSNYELLDIVDPSLRVKANALLKEKFEAFKKTKETGRYSTVGGELLSSIDMIAKNIVDDLLVKKNLNINLIDIKHLDIYDYEHSVNTAILSVVTGITMGFSRQELLMLAQGSLLMNIGIEMIDQDIFKKKGELSDDEFKIIKSHSEIGRRFLSERSILNARVKNIVYNHHERLDGSGYPRGVKKGDIDALTRVVMIADVYDSMTSDRHHRKAYSPSEALEYIMGNTDAFDLTTATAFARNITIFPIGEYIKLSNNEIAMVISSNKHLPLRPKVKVIYPNYGQIIDLKDEHNVTVMKKVGNVKEEIHKLRMEEQ